MNDLLLQIGKEIPSLVALIWIVQRFLGTLKEQQTQLVSTTKESADAIAHNTEVLRELAALVRSQNGTGQPSVKPAKVEPIAKAPQGQLRGASNG